MRLRGLGGGRGEGDGEREDGTGDHWASRAVLM
jgi:hypothetical protein